MEVEIGGGEEVRWIEGGGEAEKRWRESERGNVG
jgi:hypothetical protein